MLWTLEANPTNKFYDHLGAKLLNVRRESESQTQEIAYGWPEIERVWKRGVDG